jgi:hypothetical protein
MQSKNPMEINDGFLNNVILKNNVSVLITSTHVGWIMTCPEFDVL